MDVGRRSQRLRDREFALGRERGLRRAVCKAVFIGGLDKAQRPVGRDIRKLILIGADGAELRCACRLRHGVEQRQHLRRGGDARIGQRVGCVPGQLGDVDRAVAVYAVDLLHRADLAARPVEHRLADDVLEAEAVDLAARDVQLCVVAVVELIRADEDRVVHRAARNVQDDAVAGVGLDRTAVDALDVAAREIDGLRALRRGFHARAARVADEAVVVAAIHRDGACDFFLRCGLHVACQLVTADHIERAFAVGRGLETRAEGHVVVVADKEQRAFVLEARVFKGGVAAEVEAAALAEVERAVVVLLAVVGGDDDLVRMLGLGEVGLKLVVVDDDDGTVHVADEVVCRRKVADCAVGRRAVAVAERGDIDADHVGMALLGYAVDGGVFRDLCVACRRDLRAVLIGCAVESGDEVRRAQTMADNQVGRAVRDLGNHVVMHRFGHGLDLAAEVIDVGMAHDVVDRQAADLAVVHRDLCIAVEASRCVTAGAERGNRAAVHRDLGAAGVRAVDRCTVQILDRTAVHRDVGRAAERGRAAAAREAGNRVICTALDRDVRIQLAVHLFGRVQHGLAELIAADEQELACGGDALAHDNLVEARKDHAGLRGVGRAERKRDFLKGYGAAHVIAAVFFVVQNEFAAREGNHTVMRGFDKSLAHRIGIRDDDRAAALDRLNRSRKVAERRFRRRAVARAAVVQIDGVRRRCRHAEDQRKREEQDRKK